MIWALLNSSPTFPANGVTSPESGQFSSLSLPCGTQDSSGVWNLGIGRVCEEVTILSSQP